MLRRFILAEQFTLSMCVVNKSSWLKPTVVSRVTGKFTVSMSVLNKSSWLNLL